MLRLQEESPANDVYGYQLNPVDFGFLVSQCHLKGVVILVIFAAQQSDFIPPPNVFMPHIESESTRDKYARPSGTVLLAEKRLLTVGYA
jgi:hypothetical protein